MKPHILLAITSVVVTTFIIQLWSPVSFLVGTTDNETNQVATALTHPSLGLTLKSLVDTQTDNHSISLYYVIANTIDVASVKELVNDVIAKDTDLLFGHGGSVSRVWVFDHIVDTVVFHELKDFLESKEERIWVRDFDLSYYENIPLKIQGMEWSDPFHYYFNPNKKARPEEKTRREAAPFAIYKERMEYIRSHMEPNQINRSTLLNNLMNHGLDQQSKWSLVIDLPYYIPNDVMVGVLGETNVSINSLRASSGCFHLSNSNERYSQGVLIRNDLVNHNVHSIPCLDITKLMKADLELASTKTTKIATDELFIAPTASTYSELQLLEFAYKLDSRVITDIHRFNRDNLFNIDEFTLEVERDIFQNNVKSGSELNKLFSDVVNCAEESVSQGPFSVTHKTKDPPSKSRHDYLTLAPYWWPNPDTPDGLPYVRKDGMRVAGSALYGEGADQADSSRLWSFFGNTTCLTMGEHFTGKKKYGKVAADNIRTWFLKKETKMNPNLMYAQLKWGFNENKGEGRGIIETRYFFQLLDMIRLLKRNDYLNDKEMNELRQWFTQFLDWMNTTEAGTFEYSSKNNHGTYFDVQAAAIAAFIGDIDYLRKYTVLSQARLLEQISSDGSMPHELGRNTQLHYIMFGLQAIHDLARLTSKVGVDLWSVTREGDDKPLLYLAAKYALPHFQKNWSHIEEEDEDMNRMSVLFYNSVAAYPELLKEVVNENWKYEVRNSHYSVKNTFDQYSGIQIFWNIGMQIHSDNMET